MKKYLLLVLSIINLHILSINTPTNKKSQNIEKIFSLEGYYEYFEQILSQIKIKHNKEYSNKLNTTQKEILNDIFEELKSEYDNVYTETEIDDLLKFYEYQHECFQKYWAMIFVTSSQKTRENMFKAKEIVGNFKNKALNNFISKVNELQNQNK